MLVPTLLGLKGNLEMTLSSRLATLANAGVLDLPSNRWKVIFGNLALLQVQAACVAGFASFWSLLISGALSGKWDSPGNTGILCASAIMSACFASAFLGLSMCFTVIICRLAQIDPDNMATPIAASMGDLITLLTLAGIASTLFPEIDSPLPVILIVFILCSLPIWVILVLNNEHVKSELNSAWPIPLLIAVSISSFAGLGMERYLDKFAGLAVILPVQNGICGNLACIYASRLSTQMHQQKASLPVSVNTNNGGVYGETRKRNKSRSRSRSPRRKKVKARRDSTGTVLVIIGFIAHGVFLMIVKSTGLGNVSVGLKFGVGYFISSATLTIILLQAANILARFLKRHKLDPDQFLFPLLTAAGDNFEKTRVEVLTGSRTKQSQMGVKEELVSGKFGIYAQCEGFLKFFENNVFKAVLYAIFSAAMWLSLLAASTSLIVGAVSLSAATLFYFIAIVKKEGHSASSFTGGAGVV
ncbi:hypothetical protein HK098_004174 [Nowakowskiella sp. JEL0407]|nr:hypothetical protein HK098_004174 [Nowakowskiella sp. JEL0407]